MWWVMSPQGSWPFLRTRTAGKSHAHPPVCCLWCFSNAYSALTLCKAQGQWLWFNMSDSPKMEKLLLSPPYRGGNRHRREREHVGVSMAAELRYRPWASWLAQITHTCRKARRLSPGCLAGSWWLPLLQPLPTFLYISRASAQPWHIDPVPWWSFQWFPSSHRSVRKAHALWCRSDRGSSPGTGSDELQELDGGRSRNLPEPLLPFLQRGIGKVPWHWDDSEKELAWKCFTWGQTGGRLSISAPSCLPWPRLHHIGSPFPRWQWYGPQGG